MRRFASSTAMACPTSWRRLTPAAPSAVRCFTDATTVRKPHTHETFAYAMNSEYMQSMFEAWKQDPASVHESWSPIFSQLDSAKPDEALIESFDRPVVNNLSPEIEVTEKDIIDTLKLSWMIRAYEVRGHLIADLDPLGMFSADLDFSVPQELELAYFGFTEADMDRRFALGVLPKLGGFHSHPRILTLREVISELKKVYCNKIGWEYMHIVDSQKTSWIRSRIHENKALTPQERHDTLQDLAVAEGFEKFLHTKYATTKRFGLDGAETLIPLINKVIDEAANAGVESFIIGMAHRGRLNVLANVCGKDVAKVLLEFEGKKTSQADEENECGDVKYHLGISLNRYTRSKKPINIELLANPSHLETVDPVVCGKARAKQHYKKDKTGSKVMAILIHGDAAFAGQGVCYETMGLSDLDYYEIGGTVHIVINNQVGFTTNPNQSRSAPYCTELGKPVQAPIFHVNADHPEEAVRCAKIAVDFRNKYNSDVLIDMVCYRRFGHNETDEPSFTQPLMYKKIRAHPSTLTLYSQKVIADGVMTKEEVEGEKSAVSTKLREKFEAAKKLTSSTSDWKEDEWTSGYKNPLSLKSLKSTAVPTKILKEIGQKITTLPDTFEPHPTLRRIIQERGKNYAAGTNIDWGSAEALAIGTLVLEGNLVRISGQDVERGTFSQRHALLTDVNNESVYVPLRHVHDDQGAFRVINSSLSEYGVAGYELGYAMENAASLVMWEAQFGDFANGAQIVFDQLLCSMESKWLKSIGMVISLPHGYDGMGPEHSSGRIERYLQLSDDCDMTPIDFIKKCRTAKTADMMYEFSEESIRDHNWQVCFPTTPANYFHVLRRQIHRPFRKPLINFFSKAFLRAPNVSSLKEFGEGTMFQPVIDDPNFPAGSDVTGIQKIVLCSGQVYFFIARRIAQDNIKNVAVVRVEQISPMPWGYLDAVFQKYPKSASVMWVQEEPKNMGAFAWIRPRLDRYFSSELDGNSGRMLQYSGRGPSASTATGNKAIHDMEVKELLDGAVSL
eukprot:PhM_4_TR10153/c1_g1_i2/m.7825/K00164/OGDH, sucA; 2-oxoglutarate dehydrogenase E1 component